MSREERENAIDIIQSILDKYEEDECLVTEITIGDEDIKAFKMAIKALEKEPRKGHWNVKDNMWWVCSACGCQTRMMKKYNVPRFCPACGAKMVEPQESEEAADDKEAD